MGYRQKNRRDEPELLETVPKILTHVKAIDDTLDYQPRLDTTFFSLCVRSNYGFFIVFIFYIYLYSVLVLVCILLQT